MPPRIYVSDKVCRNCGTEFNRHVSAKGRLESLTDYEIRRFCGHECSEVWHVGANHPLFRPDGSTREDGYVRIAVNGRRVYLHRHLMEQHLGRPLKRTEHVHHIDENPENNVLENLELMWYADHHRHHYRLRGVNAKGQFTS